MPYQPIENYGIIGNLRTAALVGMDGSIDWLCLPHFDSPSLFCAILDDKIGGRFRIAPRNREHVRNKQAYRPDSNILTTRFLHDTGIGEITDFMPLPHPESESSVQIVRRVQVVRGAMTFCVECLPAFDYARVAHRTTVEKYAARFDGPDIGLILESTIKLVRDAQGVRGEFTLHEGETATFVLRMIAPDSQERPRIDLPEVDRLLQETDAYWKRWLSKCEYRGRWRETVQRSALALKLMTFEPTGAIVAAPTTSLPEGVGGTRNWDYRYTWIRDAAFTLYGLLRIGFTEEANSFMAWLSARVKESGDGRESPLGILYRIDGSSELKEIELTHLEGYKGSKPVRIGNGAAGQLQLDIYGELMDSVYLYNKYAAPISYDAWISLRGLVDWVCENWNREDEGIWEVRGRRRHFVFSKYMCWVAIDRGLRLADKRSFPADRTLWSRTRDRIIEDVMRNGWSENLQSFTQSYGEDVLDASSLLMPLTFFMAPNDPRMLATIDAIRKPHTQGGLAADGLIFRYDPNLADDGLHGPEGTFNLCSFWLVEALTRAGRTDPKRLDEARLLFEQMLGYANHLGLYAEQTGTGGEALGNFPQAFTHLALISAAFNLDRALDGK